MTYEELARARANGAAGAVEFTELLPNEEHCFKMQAIRHHIKPVKEQTIKKEKEKREKSDKPTWLPKKEYMKKLADDRRKNAALETSSDKKPDRSRSRSRHRSRSRKRSSGRKKSPANEPTKQRKRR